MDELKSASPLDQAIPLIFEERTSTHLGLGAAVATTLRLCILLDAILFQGPFSEGIQGPASQAGGVFASWRWLRSCAVSPAHLIYIKKVLCNQSRTS